MLAIVALCVLESNAHALEHTAGLRYRYAWLPDGIMDLFYFDRNDEGALPYDRPSIRSHIFGLDYTLAPEPGGGASYVLWMERQPFVIDAGYWDDRESPPDHTDGDWLDPEKGFGLFSVGANYMHELPLSSNTQPVWVSMVVGGGLGLGFKTKNITVWHPGPNAAAEPECRPFDLAPDRVDACAPDGNLGLPRCCRSSTSRSARSSTSPSARASASTSGSTTCSTWD